jgi:hypothetical protein
VPTYSPTKIVTTLKSLITREVFARCPHVKKKLWGGEFWSDGYFIAAVGQQESEEIVRQYVQQQSQNRRYNQFHVQQSQPALFNNRNRLCSTIATGFVQQSQPALFNNRNRLCSTIATGFVQQSQPALLHE